MALSVTSIARVTRLAHVADVNRLLGTGSDEAADVLQLIDEASAAIVDHCRRPFAREALTETLPGYGGIHLQLARTPIVSVSSVTSDGMPITDYSVADAEEGTLYRQLGWTWTAQAIAGLTGRQRWPRRGFPLPQQEEPTYGVTYSAGYIVPGEALVGVATVAAAASDSSFNDSAGSFAAQLVAGDVIEVAGFSNAGNCGRFLVTGTPSANKVQVAGTLVTEPAGANITVRFHNKAGWRSLGAVEKACMETVAAWYQGRQRDPKVVEEQVGGMRMRYTETIGGERGLPLSAIALLQSWVRHAA